MKGREDRLIDSGRPPGRLTRFAKNILHLKPDRKKKVKGLSNPSLEIS
ncbi:hypothetical protein LEP1GSC050_0565 [Leptospira broomii serovar Hurstbridge str. 5399]|uniref:Uncharacterized protein n=1 Tax=Leptospira broomii serovar Hurstbridge str. 5399 TaxID=1049789 RepID=T0GJM4_9LEPT|nr:hypothetical protein LEP1GSC050_0565 [Leptospira broomii serovar Hurstbridge str. 5399]